MTSFIPSSTSSIWPCGSPELAREWADSGADDAARLEATFLPPAKHAVQCIDPFGQLVLGDGVAAFQF